MRSAATQMKVSYHNAECTSIYSHYDSNLPVHSIHSNTLIQLQDTLDILDLRLGFSFVHGTYYKMECTLKQSHGCDHVDIK